MVDVSRWLTEQGLGHCAEAFAKNDIAGDILRDLTDADLRELGLNLGDRKRLLKAIAALPAAAPAQDEAEAAGRTAERAVARDAERRQLTVLFCDLVGSTELSRRLDPEEMSEVIRAYHKGCADVIRRWEGHVSKYMGDGVLAYYGWPRAHEDDAERAVRAGLELAKAVGEQTTSDGTMLAARIGIATGQVVVGELIGEGAAQEEAVVGETPNLAARLQALAEPGAVVVAASTRRLLGNLFALTDLGPRRLKGFAEPLAAWRVEGEGGAEGRFEALHGGYLTPLVGREHELGILLERWTRAKDADGQVVLIVGEPGIGKSRLLRALREELTAQPHIALSHYCSPHHTNSALYPIITQLERSADFGPDDEAEAKLTKLEAMLGLAAGQVGEAVPLLAALLGIPVSERYPALNLAPQRQKQRTLEVLIEHLVGLARAQPVLELYEDLHWVDPSTLELLDLLVESVRTLRVLMVMTFRPEFSTPWSGHAHVTSLPLNRLGRRQGAAIVDRLTGGKSLPSEILAQIIAKTDGVPLFVEELTKAVLESELLRDAGERYELTGALPPLAIPSSLHDSLMARLDRLAPVREVAQIGAAIGREFSHELLAAVADMSTDELVSALNQLVEAELVFRHGSPPSATYSFKHALVQDAAYQSLLKSRRQQLHARIVRAIRQHLPDLVEQQPEVVAHHLSEAGMLTEAVVCWRKAADRAARNSAHREATAHASKGIELLRLLPETPERAEQELALQLIRAESSCVTAGYAASIAGQAYGRAAELTAQIGDPKQQFRVLDGYWTYHAVEGNVRRAYEVAQQMAALAAEVGGGTDHHILAFQAMGVSSLFLGEFRHARDYLAEALHASPGMGDQSRARRGSEPQAVCLVMDGLALWATGYPDRGLARAREAVERADVVRYPFARAFVRGYLSLVHHLRREPDGAADAAQAMAAIAHDEGFSYLRSVAQLRLGAVLMPADRDEGARLLRQGLDGQRATGSTLHLLYGLIVYAEACLAAGWLDEAGAAINEGQQLVRFSTVRWCEAEIHRLAGELCYVRGAARQAEAGFERARAVARQQQARSFELRAAMGVARLWRDQARLAEAHDLLAPVYGCFTEGFDTADLKDAKALLDELA